MIIMYTPDGGEPQRFDMRKLKTSEAQIVCRTTDMPWAQVKRGVLNDEPETMRAVVWALLKREQPALRFGEFDPQVDELTSRFDAREVADYCTEIGKAGGSEDDIDGAYRDLARNAADPDEAEKFIADFRGAGPKEPAKSRTSKTGS
ncbi:MULTISPECIES: hypothetical protein [unclassified Streptomyces]|uniref:hypothetical protein n=1 Tax=Streptomyces sp. NPDC127129 TaxID=3345373 RepID=UPI00363CE66F